MHFAMKFCYIPASLRMKILRTVKFSPFLARQELNSTPNNQADLDLEVDPQYSTDAVGYTIETAIYSYENMFDAHTSVFLAGRYAHEYCHTLGFRDPDSLMDTSRNVPDEIGRIVSELATGSNIHLHFMDPAAQSQKKQRKKEGGIGSK
jgi:hypothetical protein